MPSHRSILPVAFALPLAAAGALVVAVSCLSPGSLDEGAFRISQADTSGDGSTGCTEACALLEAKCAGSGCHGDSSPAADLSLTTEGLVDRLTAATSTTQECSSGRILVPGSPQDSLVYTKLLDPPSCGIRMPYGGALEQNEIDCIARWVLSPNCGTSAPPLIPDGGRAPDASPPVTVPDATTPRPDATTPRPDAAPPGPDAEPPIPEAGGTTDETVWLEGEDAATLIPPMAVGSDPNASGTSFISAETGTKIDDAANATTGIASFLFEVRAGGTYTIFGRVLTPADANDSFWVRVDDGAWVQWNNLPHGTDWVWDDVHDTAMLDAVVTYPLTVGSHALSVIYRETGARLDKLAVTNVAGFTPSGVGQ